ncbi:MAG: hypothetical protein OXL37_15135 [Chloroflexota bacterium]|nr:hypothetical protein [Chloroflexota bacterium]MDE2961719.1 hypothetical protein [Chloroflexota bacterium]
MGQRLEGRRRGVKAHREHAVDGWELSHVESSVFFWYGFVPRSRLLMVFEREVK